MRRLTRSITPLRVEHDDHRPGDVEVLLRAGVLGRQLLGAALAAVGLPDAHHRGEGERHQLEGHVGRGLAGERAGGGGGRSTIEPTIAVPTTG